MSLPCTVELWEASLTSPRDAVAFATNYRFLLGLRSNAAVAEGRRLGERDEPLQFPGLLVALQAIDEIDLDLRVVKAGCGEPIDDLLA